MKKIIIYAPSYSDKVGGVIALHKLCDLINRIGHDAYIYPMFRNTAISKKNFFVANLYILRELIQKLWSKFLINPEFNTPIINKIPKKLDEFIVIYPEITLGNPLNAKNVVRWLLHNPGFHTKEIYFGIHEFYIKYHHGFDDFFHYKSFTSKNILQIKHYPINLYNLENTSEKREGTAYCLRKGAHKKIIHDLNNSVLIDNLSHQEISQIFKSVKTFISYDPNTAFSHLAVLCGCDSVVIPDDGISEEEWYPNVEDRYGIAYGFENSQKAKLTKNNVLKGILNSDELNIQQTKLFLSEVKAYFEAHNDQFDKPKPKFIKKVILCLKAKYRMYLIKKNLHITKLTPYQTNNWHHEFSYFTGEIEGKKVFVKSSSKFYFLINDYLAEKKLRDTIKTPRVLAYFFGDTFQCLAFEFIDGVPLNIDKLTKAPEIFNEMIDLINSIREQGVFHRDIKLNNFILDKNNNLYLIDFTFSVSEDGSFKELDSKIKEQFKILKSLGQNDKPSELHWNDKFTIKKVLERFLNYQKLHEAENHELKKIYINLKNIDSKFSYHYSSEK